MANDASIGRHTMQQVQRLERNLGWLKDKLNPLSGGDFKMPDHNRYGKEFLFIDQLKAVNICLEGLLGVAVEAEAETAPEPEVVSVPMVQVMPLEEMPESVLTVGGTTDEPMVIDLTQDAPVEEFTPTEPESVDEPEPESEEVVSAPKTKNKRGKS